MAAFPSLNRRHKAGLVLVLAVTGASLLFEASAKQTAGIVLLGLAATWFFGSVAVRTLGIILSVIAFCAGLYFAVSPVWHEREAVLAMAREYDAMVSTIREAAVKCEEYEKYKKFETAIATPPPGAAKLEPIPFGATLLDPNSIRPQYAVDIPLAWLRSPSPVEAIDAKHGGSIEISLGGLPPETVVRRFQNEILLPRPAFSLKHSIASHWSTCLGGGLLSLAGLLGCVFLIRQARLRPRLRESTAPP